MGRIERRKSKWTYIGLLVVGIGNPVVGLILNNSQTLLVVLYLLLISIAIYLIFFRKAGWRRDFIQWNEESIRIHDGGVEFFYDWEAIDQVVLRNNHLLVKSGKANGYMMDLKGFSSEDLDKFQGYLRAHSQGNLTAS